MARRLLRIENEKGLHARAAARFVETVERFAASATVSRDGLDAPGDSIMGLLTLAAAQGAEIEIVTEGDDDEALMTALSALIGGRFGEER